ncbi:unnamed protein product [Orchesella dallaii]|uniref:Uncharacterized protein n=1 Tax=Orchesella dallaii TaxID=48710 RepID=A0ABP1QXA1_9HEXA
MHPRSLKISFLSLLVVLILIENCTAGKRKKHKDDDDDDDDPDCYPGRNCIPGCYCAGEECRPYDAPKTHQHGKWACRPFNYPKWKVWKKGPKDDIGNSTVIVMAHHLSEKSDHLTSLLATSNFTTFEFQDLTSTLAKDAFENGTNTEQLLPSHVLSTSTPQFLSKLWNSDTISNSTSTNETETNT